MPAGERLRNGERSPALFSRPRRQPSRDWPPRKNLKKSDALCTAFFVVLEERRTRLSWPRSGLRHPIQKEYLPCARTGARRCSAV